MVGYTIITQKKDAANCAEEGFGCGARALGGRGREKGCLV